MAYVPVSLDLHERIALGIQSVIQTTLCPLTDAKNVANKIPASQVYVQDWPIPETGTVFPAVVISVEGEVERDDKIITFLTDASIYPCVLRIADRRDLWDQSFEAAWKKWRKAIGDLLRTLTTLPDCPEVYNVWADRRAIYEEDKAALEYVTSAILVQGHAYYSWSR